MENQPLADRLRPQNLDEIVGQEPLVGPNGIIRRMIEHHRINNMIFYGPPGVGKTTVAKLVARESEFEFHELNATNATLQDVKDIADHANSLFGYKGILLYLDEIQYFNKKQQQSLLPYTEDGRIILIASTTENPYISIYNALLSRSSIFEFKPVSPKAIKKNLQRALTALNTEFQEQKKASEELFDFIAQNSGGDVRRSINLLENTYYISEHELSIDLLKEQIPVLNGIYDRNGDQHYDLMACLQKSIRGSDPDASIFYLAKMLAAGDLISPIRRLQVIASEDIGLAYPLASVITRACVESARDLGLPEASIPLANCVLMLATAPKSNSANEAYQKALGDVSKGLGLHIPKHLHGPNFEGYLYPHDYPYHYVAQQYLPDDLLGKKYYEFGQNKTELLAKQYYDMMIQATKK